MTAKKETIWVLMTYLDEDYGPGVEGVYRTKAACQKAFENILQCIWPEGMTTDDEDRTKKACIDALLFFDDERGNYLEGTERDIEG